MFCDCILEGVYVSADNSTLFSFLMFFTQHMLMDIIVVIVMESQLLQRAITKHRVRDMIRMPGSFCDHKEDYILYLQPKMVYSQN